MWRDAVTARHGETARARVILSRLMTAAAPPNPTPCRASNEKRKNSFIRARRRERRLFLHRCHGRETPSGSGRTAPPQHQAGLSARSHAAGSRTDLPRLSGLYEQSSQICVSALGNLAEDGAPPVDDCFGTAHAQAPMPFATATPRSSKNARISFTAAVRSPTRRARTRCSA